MTSYTAKQQFTQKDLKDQYSKIKPDHVTSLIKTYQQLPITSRI